MCLIEVKTGFQRSLVFSNLHLVARILSSTKCPLGNSITMLGMCELKTEIHNDELKTEYIMMF